jgi:hypothetical protein
MVGRFAATKLDLVVAILNTRHAIVATGKLRRSSYLNYVAAGA